MPSRDDRTPSFCSERMKICQKHLSKVYSRSKSLLVTARAGKVVPEVTGSAARGYADGSNNSRDGTGLSKFEKEKLSPFLNAVAGLFDGPSLLKQFQLKKLQTGLADRNFKTQSQPDCPQSCHESSCQDRDSVSLSFTDNPSRQPSARASEHFLDNLGLSNKTSTIQANSSVLEDNWSKGAGYIKPNIGRDCAMHKPTPEGQGRVQGVMLQNASISTLSTVPEERISGRQTNSDRQLQVGMSSSSSFLPTNYRVDDMGKWDIPPYLSNLTSEKKALSKLVVPQAALPLYQQSIGKAGKNRIGDKSVGNRHRLLPGTDQHQRAISTMSHRNSSQVLPVTESQQRVVSTDGVRNSMAGTVFKEKVVNMASGRSPPQLAPGSDSQHRPAAMSGRNPQSPAGPDLQLRAVSTNSDNNPRQLPPGADLRQETGLKGPFHTQLGAAAHQRAFSNTTQKSLLQQLQDNDSKQKSVSALVESQPGTFASQLIKKVPKSGNVLQASVANFFGTPGGLPKPFHTLTVSQVHDAICDHTSPDCPSFRKRNLEELPQSENPTLTQPRHSLEEHDPPQVDALGAEGSTNPQSVDEFAPSQQEVISANEKCAQYAFEVRTDTKRQEKSSANLWKYGSMAVCTENPGRDYTTGESPPDAWELMAKSKLEVTGIHWSKSGSRKVVNHVCQILKHNKWGKGAMELLDAVKGTVSTHCVNAVLQQQKDPQLCLAFFNWAKRQKGYKHDVFAFTTMINILGRARNLRGVRHLLEDMHRGGIEPTAATYNTLILCYGKVESLNESMRVFRIMQEAGCKPDNVTYSILIHLCIKAGYLEDALKLYQGMLEAGVQPDTITYSIVIDSLGKSGNLREARKLFCEMKERGYVPNEFTYNSIINRHAKARKMPHALKYFTEMRGAGFKLNAVTCTTMMSVMGSLGKFEQAEGLFLEMQQAGIVADTAAYSLMINMWGNSGNLDKAVSWYGRMLGNLVTPSLSVFSSLVNAHLEANLYQAVQHFLTSMGMWGINSDLKLYTILLRHCTVCERQEHADAVLGIMDNLGHPAHCFLYDLLTSKNQDRQATTSRVVSYFDSLEQEDQDNKQGFANALIDFLYKLQCKTDPGFVWEIAMEKGLFPSAILQRQTPNHWLIDLHSMSIGTALVALPRLLVMLRDNWIQHPTKRVYIVTGWGKRSRVTGASALKQAVNDLLDATKSTFSLDHTNAGVFVSYGSPFCDWISEPSIMKKLGVMTTTGVVK